MFKTPFLAILIIAFQHLSAQFSKEEQTYIDSLTTVINNSSEDTSVAVAYINLSELLFVENLDTLGEMSLKAIEIADKNLSKKNISKKEEMVFKLVKGNAFNNIGYLFDVKGQLQEALEYYYKSLTIREEMQSYIGIATTLNNIAMVYDIQENDAKALEIHRKALQAEAIIDDTLGMAYSYMNMAAIFVDQNNEDSSLYYYDKCIKMYSVVNDNRGLAAAYVGMGSYYKQKNDIEKSYNFFQKALTIFQTQASGQGEIECLYSLGELYLIQGNLNQAKANGLLAYEKAQALGQTFLLQNSARLLMLVYRKQRKFENAINMYDVFVKMKDSIRNDANDKSIIQQQVQHEYEKQHLSDSLSNVKEKALKEIEHKSQLDKEKNQRYGLYGGIVFLILLGGGALRGYQRKKKDNEVIKAQKEILEEAHSELEEKNQEIMDSITYAKRIQSAILPPQKIVKEYLQESFILYKPKDIVAGDFYWLDQKDNRVLFAAADCTGHGVPGAMVSVVCNNALNRSVREYNLIEPGEILTKAREIVISEFAKSDEDVKDGMDIALCSLEGNTLKYAGAHNPLWVIRKDGKEVEEIKANKQPIGKYHIQEPYTTHTVKLEKGDSIFIFSDGYADQFGGEKGKKFKAANFKALLLSIQKEPISRQKELIDNAFEKWKGALDQIDDVCVIGVRF